MNAAELQNNNHFEPAMSSLPGTACRALLYGSFIFAILCSFPIIFSFISAHGQPALVAALTAFFILLPCLSWSLTLTIFILLLPAFGNRPGTQQVMMLLLVSAATHCGFLLSLARKSNRFVLRSASLHNPILFLTLAYLFISAFSLSSMPLYRIISDLNSQVYSYFDWSAMSYWILKFSASSEEKITYSFLSLLWTCFAFNLMFAAYCLIRSSSHEAIRISCTLLISLCLTLLLGLADYYGLTDLRNLRSLDPVVNPGNYQFRMQSLFGHSGWFAEYITLCIPFVMVILLLKRSFMLRLGLILLMLLLGEYCLILSFQRGGWISYPLTLFVIWAAVYVSRRIELGEKDFLRAFRSSFLKVLLSIPITLAVSALLLVSLNKTGVIETEQTSLLSRYVDRFSDIKKTSDRTEFFQAGFLIGKLHPFMGGGSESFAYHFEKEFEDTAGNYYQVLNLPLHGSSHNVYMQTFSGKGAAGLLTLLLLMISLIVYPIKSVLFNSALKFDDKIILLICCTFSFAFLIYGNVQEIFYVQPLQYITFLVFALAAASLPSNIKLSSYSMRLAIIIMLAVAALHLIWENFLHKVSSVSDTEFGCHALENDNKGRAFRWCAARASRLMPVQDINGKKRVSFTIEGGPWKNNTHSQLTVKSGGLDLYTTQLERNTARSLAFDLPDFMSERIINNNGNNYVRLDLESASYFIPARDFKGSSDMRILSFKLMQ